MRRLGDLMMEPIYIHRIHDKFAGVGAHSRVYMGGPPLRCAKEIRSPRDVR